MGAVKPTDTSQCVFRWITHSFGNSAAVHFTVYWLSAHVLTCWQMVFRTYFAYTSKLAVSMETLRPSDMSSRPAGCDSPEPLSSASPTTTTRRHLPPKPLTAVIFETAAVVSDRGNSLTEHEDGFEDSEHCSHHYAVLRSSQKVAVTGRADSNC